jgi:hypothetical protein
MVKTFFSSVAALLLFSASIAFGQVNSFNIGVQNVGPCGRVIINGGFSIVGGNAGAAVEWDWGDGGKGQSFFPARHLYQKEGTYQITARLWRGNAILSTRTISVNVAIAPSCGPRPKANASVQGAQESKSSDPPDFLMPTRSEYEKVLAKIAADKNKDIEVATVQYMKNLNSMLEKCMDERRLEDAIEVRREIERLQGFMPVAEESLNDSLVLHFTFDRDESGNSVTDKSGLGNNGRAKGAHWTAEGQRGGGFEFGRGVNYITVPNSDSLNPRRLTLAVWIKTGNKDKDWRRLFDKYLPSGFALTLAGDYQNRSWQGQVSWEITESGQNRFCASGNQVTDERWHHIASTFDGQFLQIYVDGEPSGRPIRWQNPGDAPKNSHDLTIGLNRSNPDPNIGEEKTSFIGTMDDVMMFNRALSAKEIRKLFEIQSATASPQAPQAQPKASSEAGKVSSERAQASGILGGQVAFKSAEKAPSGFSSWSFSWESPTKDPDAKLEFVVLRPDGTEYFRYDASRVYDARGAKAGILFHSDFGLGRAGGDPSIFYNQAITIVFKASKGGLAFDPNGKYYFSFPMDKKVATTGTPRESPTNAASEDHFEGVASINQAFMMAKEKVVFIVPTHEADKEVEQKIRAYVEEIRDRNFKGALILSDEQALQRDLSSNSILTYGTPIGNLWLIRNLALLPVRIESGRIVADKEYPGTNLRFISAWPNPQNPRMGLVVYTAQQAKDIVGISHVLYGQRDYVVAQDTTILKADNYSKQDGRWQFPTVIDAIMENR